MKLPVATGKDAWKIYFDNNDQKKVVTQELIDSKHFKVNLDMFRGLNDTFYYALRDESAVSDALT